MKARLAVGSGSLRFPRRAPEALDVSTIDGPDQTSRGSQGENGHLPAFGLFDIGARFIPDWGRLEGWTASFTLDNLFDTRYADYGVCNGADYGTTVYPGCGRSFMFSIRYEF